MEITANYKKHGIKHALLPDNLSSYIIPSLITQSSSIYHYTSISGLMSILKNRTLRFTNIRYLNDREEVNVGIDQLANITSSIYSKFDAGQKILKHVELSAHNLKKQGTQTYICCFSVGNDELAMWNYYTKDPSSQGYNIGFYYKDLICSLLKLNPELENCTLTFGLVDYCIDTTPLDPEPTSKKKSYIDLIGDEYTKLIDEVLQNQSTTDFATMDEKIKVLRYAGSEGTFRTCHLPELVFFLKKDYFYAEKEFRIVINVPDDTIDKFIKEHQRKYQYRTNNGMLIPFLELDFDVDSIIGIKSSPTNNGELLEESIVEYCKYCSIDSDCFPEGISHSRIPLRF